MGTGAGGVRGQGGGTVSAVNPVVALKNSLDQPQDRTALVYRTDGGDNGDNGLYLRIVALDRFDGAQWKPSERRIGEIPDQLPAPRGLGPEVRTSTVRTTIQASDAYAQDWLPMPFPADRVRLEGKWRFEPEGRTLVGYDKQTTRGLRYTVESLQVRPTAEQLRNAPDPPPALEREYTAIPGTLPDVVSRTARQVTRGAANDYERAVRLQDWFADEGGFVYDTEVEAGTGVNAISDFLRQKEGFCVHFSFAMASMARTLGVPARVAVGFTPGTARGNGAMEVGFQDAHAWPELYFEGVGWTRFEPTPTRGTTPPYARPDAPDPDRDSGEVLPDRNGNDEPTVAPSPSQECTAQQKRSDPECGLAAPLPGSGGSAEGPSTAALVGIGGAALLLLALLLLPMLLRRRRRSRRLRSRPGGTGPEAAEGVLAAWQELLDTGWDYGIVPEDSATPRTAAERLARVGELQPPEAEAVQRIALAVEQVLYAPEPRPAPGIARDVQQVRAGLRAAAPRTLRVRALLLPPSTGRLLRAAGHRGRTDAAGPLDPRGARPPHGRVAGAGQRGHRLPGPLRSGDRAAWRCARTRWAGRRPAGTRAAVREPREGSRTAGGSAFGGLRRSSPEGPSPRGGGAPLARPAGCPVRAASRRRVTLRGRAKVCGTGGDPPVSGGPRRGGAATAPRCGTSPTCGSVAAGDAPDPSPARTRPGPRPAPHPAWAPSAIRSRRGPHSPA